MPARAFIPEDRRQALAAGLELPERAQGTALFADVSGFTRLTEALAASWGQRQGAEVLSQYLGTLYTALIGEVGAYRGSVIGFSGDAITCWFDGDRGARAAAAALAMQRAMATLPQLSLPNGETQHLAVKAALVRGPARRFAVGRRPRFDVLAGRTLDLLVAAEKLARPGEVVMAEAGLSAEVTVAAWREDPASGQRVALVEGLRQPLSPAPWPEPAELLEAQQAPWLLAPVYEQLVRGGGRFLAGFRPAAALFLSFGGIDYDGDPQAGQKLGAFVDWVQEVAGRYEGAMIQLTTGDKGSYLYLAFGAPLLHRDDAARAVAAALELQRLPEGLAHMRELRIGIAYGQMYAGTYGSSSRRTYGVLGHKTNLAARLMTRAGPGGVVCDGETMRRAKRAWAFEALGTVSVKGKDEPVEIYSPTGRLGAAEAERERPLVGREAELARLREAVRCFELGQGQVLRIEGQAGSGKTRLVAELAAMARAADIPLLAGAGQDVEAETPYRAWRDVFEAHFGIADLGDPRAQLAAVRRQLSEAERAWLPLLEDVLNLGLSDSPEVKALGAEARRERLFALLGGLLERRQGPFVIVLEDAHWLDSLSWDLAEHLARAFVPNAPCLLVIAGRPLDERARAVATLEALASLPACSRLELADLSPTEAAQLAAQQLGVTAGELPDALLRLVAERASGNPFVIEEVLRTLLERKLVSVSESPPRVRLADLARGSKVLPDTIEGLILSRLDRLAPEQQALLKVAAVIGRVFASATLRDTLARLETLQAFRPHSLRELVRQGFIQPDLHAELAYSFRHLVTYEAVYESLLFSQRHHIHRLVAEWYETTQAGRLQDYTALLAHHYANAAAGGADGELVAKAVHYLEAVAQQDVLLGALGEALSAQRRLLELLPASPAWAAKRAQALVRIGSLHEKTSDYAAASASLEAGIIAAREASDARTEVEAYAALCVVGLRQGDYPGAQAMGERALELAERHQDDPGAAQARASLAIIAAYQGDFATAKRHFAAGVAVYRQLGDREQVGSLLNNLGIVAIYEKAYPSALEHLAEALAAARQLKHRGLIAKVTANLGLVEEKLGRYPAAEHHYRESLEIFEEIGAKQDAVINVLSLGDVAAAQGEARGAWARYLDAFVQAQALNALPTALLALRGLAALLVDEQPHLAAEWLGFALKHPASNSEIEEHAAPVLARLEALLPALELREALERGRGLELAAVAEQARALG